jgi:hypothetical protein
MTLYNGFLPDVAARFQKRFDEIKVVDNFDHGDELEVAVCQVLREILPRSLGVCRGYVVSRNGAMAGDDIIVFDSSRFPTLRFLGDDLSRKEQVPAEAVLTYLEVKHTLYLEPKEKNKGQSLAKAVSQVAAVKAVQRPRVEISQVIPGVSLAGFMSAGFMQAAREAPGWPEYLNPWYGMILARRLDAGSGEPREAMARRLAELAVTSTALPDIVAAGDVVVFPALVRRGENGMLEEANPRPFLCDSTELITVDCPGLSLGLAAFHLLWAIEKISLGRIPWPEMLTESLGRHFTATTPPLRPGLRVAKS